MSVGSAFIDLTPEWLKSVAIATFGDEDRTTLLAGIVGLTSGAALAQSPAASMAPMGDTPFDAACAAVPMDGAAGLVDTLNGAEGITVLAPTDDAFAALDPATLEAALADPTGLLTTVLTYHVVPGRLSPDMLAGTHPTLQGDEVTVEGMGDAFTVNGASIVCGNVQTANATVYLIDAVLLPSME